MYDQLRDHDYVPTLRWASRICTRRISTELLVAAMGRAVHQHAYPHLPIAGLRHQRLLPVAGLRMSFYTGRYASSHGAQWNGFPLRVGELTLGDHLRELGMDTWLIGKTHMKADAEGMARLGLAPDSVIGARQAECGFDVWVRDDGLWGEGPDGFYDERRSPYNEYLKSKGYDGDQPLGRLRQCRASRTGSWRRAGCSRTPTSPPTSARRTAKPPG
jgi:arylsulfatase A-like enzyme